jgi:hypothetical protein
VSIPKNTRGRASCLALSQLSMWTDEIQGRSGDCVLHEQIVILYLPAKCYQKNKGLVSMTRGCIENTEPALSSSRLSLDRHLFVVQLPQRTNATFNLDYPG